MPNKSRFEFDTLHEEVVKEIAKFNPYYHKDDPKEIFLLQILQELETNPKLSKLLAKSIIDRKWREIIFMDSLKVDWLEWVLLLSVALIPLSIVAIVIYN